MAQILTDQLRLMAEHHPDEIGFTDVVTDEDLTFRAWEERSNRLARWLVAQGVAKGDRVAVHVPPEEGSVFLISYSAVHKAGAVAVPTNTRLVARELAYVLGHAGAGIIISGRSSTPRLLEVRDQIDDLRLVVTTADPGDDPGLVAWDDATDDDASEIQVPVTGDDMADLMYTSGTTGRPKAVVVRHGNIALMPNGLPQWSGSGWLHSSPMFTFAGIAATYNPMKLGMRLLYLPRFDVDRWLDAVEQRRPTMGFLVPAMAEMLLASPRWADADLSSISLCSLGSAPLAPTTLQALRDKMPNAMVMNAWGMTEAGPAYCLMPPEEAERRIGSVGQPVPPVEFRIVDEAGEALPAGEIGQLLVHNPGREREYFNDPEATAAAWQDGWLHTGDVAYLDEDGYLYLVGRQKDVIIRGGNNVHAADVEAVLYEHPGVQEAVVAGVPHDVLGEEVGAWIVPIGGTDLDEAELRAFCAERLTGFKVPTAWRFLDELPRNPTGKVVKAELPGR